jgi:sulfatase-modifying factor enzyme 1
MKEGGHMRRPGWLRTMAAWVGIALVACGMLAAPTAARASGEALFVGLTPCRLVDTRGNGFAGPFGPPGLPASVPRDFPLIGQCGLPAEALAVSLNVTATNTLGPGFFALYPAGGATPLVSTLNYLVGETIANAALVPLSPGGITAVAGVSGADLILDVNGYFVDVAFAGCPPSMVRSGPTCIDKYEASVWETTDPTVMRKIRAGTVTLAELQAAGAIQRGIASDDYAPGCPPTGNGCVNLYAVSVAGVTPSGSLGWFQAVAVARNAGKRLPTSAEWQAAALGTPDGAPCVVTAGGPALTGTAGCVSDVGAFDMVGNLAEWVADWVPLSNSCVPAIFLGTDDQNCLAGAEPTSGPGAVYRGGGFSYGIQAGVFAVGADRIPLDGDSSIGFRAAR